MNVDNLNTINKELLYYEILPKIEECLKRSPALNLSDSAVIIWDEFVKNIFIKRVPGRITYKNILQLIGWFTEYLIKEFNPHLFADPQIWILYSGVFNNNLKTITLGKNISKIISDTFYKTSLEEINYLGTEEEFQNIEKSPWWDMLSGLGEGEYIWDKKPPIVLNCTDKKGIILSKEYVENLKSGNNVNS